MKDNDNLTILDLINKIAYNEEIPSLIKVFGCEWKWSDEYCDYDLLRFSDYDKFETTFLFRYIFRESNKFEDKYSLNEIVYLLDNKIEDKKIEKLEPYIKANVFDDLVMEIARNRKTINELIDEVNKLKGGNNEK